MSRGRFGCLQSSTLDIRCCCNVSDMQPVFDQRTLVSAQSVRPRSCKMVLTLLFLSSEE